MKKWQKILLVLLIIALLLILTFCIFCGYIINQIDKDAVKNVSFLTSVKQTNIYDNEDKLITQTSNVNNNTILYDQLPQHTINAFIAIEDQKFFEHKGINAIRIIKAGFKNLINGYAKEGASTITQQLVKNTIVGSEKTWTRKIQEAYLAMQIEKNFTKEEILQTYLNVIYFGSGAYGIESASKTFFGCSASELNLEQSATLAGIIKSPQYYSPFENKENCIKRRNLVLLQMFKQNKITQEQYENAKNTDLEILEEQISDTNDLYLKYTIAEASKILNISEKDLVSSGLKIYTYKNSNEQDELYNSFSKQYDTEFKNKEIDSCLVVIDNKTNGINCLISNTNKFLPKRQPASLIKPILCYAPAFELNLLAPASPILDETITYGNYTPKNVDNKTSGWISTREALAKSKNIPAVKVLDYVGIDKAKQYAEKLGIKFDKTDNHLAISLGAMKYGVSPLEIANAYTAFANNGLYKNYSFIKKIENKNGKTLYVNDKNKTEVFRDDTSYQINDILQYTTKIGTAKRLSKFNNLCVKTGTMGIDTNNCNSDIWCVAYNKDKTICSWSGNTTGNEINNLNSNQNGGTTAARFCEIALNKINLSDEKFEKPESITELKIDTKILEAKQILCLKNDNTQEKYVKSDIFSKYFEKILQEETNKILQPPKITAKRIGENLIFEWAGYDNLEYKIYKILNYEEKLITTIKGKSPTTTYSITIPNETCEFYVTFINQENETIKSNVIKYYKNKNNNINLNKNIKKSWFF